MSVMRPIEAIEADPQASEAEVRWLATQSHGDALLHPNCPPDLWFELAGKYPFEAQRSPLFSLITLECPDRWAALEDKHRSDWIGQNVAWLPEKKKHLFAADCAEHALWCWEALYPEDLRPRACIAARRQFAQTEMKTSWEQNAAAIASLAAAKEKPKRSDVSWANVSVAHAIADAKPEWVAEESARVVGITASDAVPTSGQFTAAWLLAVRQERKWQWACLQKYLEGER